jgi:4-amino-4-deoxy-L-arabinose transferase-like glycosyltransferase
LSIDAHGAVARAASLDRDRAVAIAVVALVTLLHVAAGAGLKLSVDEAHYTLYGVHLDWSYYDHPPLIGWLQWLLLRLGDSALVLRTWAFVGYVAISALVYRIARDAAVEARVSPSRAATIAVLLVAGMPAAHFMGIGFVPEVPFAVAALCLVLPVERLTREPARMQSWLAVGALLGLAGLSKYTALLLAIGLVIFIVWERRWRWFTEPGAWLAVVIGLCMIAPVIDWNARHDWASFAYQWRHVEGGDSKLHDVALFVVGQIVTYSVVVTFAVWRPLLAARTTLARLLASLGTPIVVAGVLSGGKPHWTYAGWLLLAPLVACRLAAPAWSRGLRVAAVTSAAVSALTVGGMLTLLVFRPIERFPFTAPGLSGLIGWDDAARRANQLRAEVFPADAGATLMVANWTYAGRLAWYARPVPVQLNDDRRSQFDYWFGKPHGPAILVQPVDDETAPPPKLAIPMDCRFLEELVTPPKERPANRFRFYGCTPSGPGAPP